MNLPKVSRKEAGSLLGVSQRQIQRYLRFGSEFLGIFNTFFDPATNELNGFPLTQKEVTELTKIQELIRKYKNTKNKHEQIKTEFNHDSDRCSSSGFNP